MNLRIPLVLLVAASCLYCSASHRRESRTSAAVGGGYLRTGSSSYGCGGELLSTQDHRQSVGSLGVEHESESGFSAAVEVAAGRGEVVGYASRPSQQQPVLSSATPMPSYRILGGHARLGYDLAWIGAELGLQLFAGEIGALPYGLLRVGSFDQGLSFEAQAGQRRATVDPSLLTVGMVYKTPLTRLKTAVGFVGRGVQRYEQRGTRLEPSDWVIGSFANGLDPGLLFDFETRLDERLAVRVGAVLGEQWGATIDLVLALFTSSADDREVVPRPLPDAPAPAEPAPAGEPGVD